MASNQQKYQTFEYKKQAKATDVAGKHRFGPSMSVTSDEKRSFAEIFKVLKQIFSYVGKYQKVIIGAFILAAISSILMMLGPTFIGKIADAIQESITTDINMYEITKLAVILIVIYGSSAILSFTQQYILAGTVAKVCKKFRSDYIEKINVLPASYFNTHSQGNILSCVTNDIQTMRQGISRCLPGLIESITQFVSCMIIMLITEWRLTLCVYAVSFIGLLFIVIIMKKSQKFFDARQNNLGSLNGLIEEMYTGYKIIKLNRAQKSVLKQFNKGNLSLYKTDYMSQFISGLMPPMMGIIGNFAIAAVIIFGTFMAVNGLISFGAIAAFLLFSKYCTQPLQSISQNLTMLQSVCAAGTRLFKLFSEKEIESNSKTNNIIKNPKGNIEFKNVKFSYPSNPDKIIINNFSAKIKAGQKVAIVGHTGAGKTTLINLLMRFYQVNSGQITIDGIPINELSSKNIHELFGMVLQDTWLFEGSYRENLVYNLKNVEDEKLIEVCKTCGIYKDIMTSKNGLDTIISEKDNISMGSRQLITIARAMIQDSPMLILDEATSSVDTRTEQTIQKAMDKLVKGRTSFVIAHRLSTIKNADLILLIENGDIIESGTHESLINLGKKYYELYNSQFQED